MVYAFYFIFKANKCFMFIKTKSTAFSVNAYHSYLQPKKRANWKQFY